MQYTALKNNPAIENIVCKKSIPVGCVIHFKKEENASNRQTHMQTHQPECNIDIS